jgi:hypothetical protein
MSDFIGQLAPGAQKICQQRINFARNFPQLAAILARC